MAEKEMTERLQNSSLSKAVWVVLIVVAAALTLFYALRYSISAVFFFSIATYASIAMLAFLVHSCLVSHRMTRRGSASIKMLFSVLGIAVLLAAGAEFLTLVGAPVSTPTHLSDWSKKRLLVFFLLFVTFQMVYLFCSEKTGKEATAFSSLREGNFLRVLASGSSIVLTLIAVLVFVLMALVVSNAVGAMAGVVAGRITLFALVTLAGVVVLALMSFGIVSKPEEVFLALCLLSGSFLVFALPPVTAISWDDEIHYDRALGLSFLSHSEFSEADSMLVHKPWAANDLNFDTVEDYVEITNQADEDADRSGGFKETTGLATPVRGVSLAEVSTIGYFPSAIGLWLARLFQLPFSLSVIVGRLGNLISYAIVIAFAIRVSPLKKGVMAAIGLLPTSVFLASNYSYDPVVISFLMLAVALILRELHNPNRPLTLGSMLSIVATLFVGLAPKAIYFPVLGLMFLMPKSKFSSKKSYSRFISCVIIFALLMVCSFILPMLFSASVQAGDVRGGSDVSASGQIAYILSHPIEYARTLGTFMLSYLSPVNADMYSVFYAYMGTLTTHFPWISSIPFMCLAFVVCIDVSSERTSILDSRGRAWTAFLVVVSVILVCTSLYVSFTPVGLETINGCQPRYLTPLLLCAALAVPAFNSNGNAGCSVGEVAPSVACPASLKFGCWVMLILLALCSFNLVVFW